jgi:arginase family enzyme
MSRFATFPTFFGDPSMSLDSIVGADIVEVSPPSDGPSQITAFLANRVALEILNGMVERRLDA